MLEFKVFITKFQNVKMSLNGRTYQEMISMGVSKDIKLYPQRFEKCLFCYEHFQSNAKRMLLACGHFLCYECMNQLSRSMGCPYPNCNNKNLIGKAFDYKLDQKQDKPTKDSVFRFCIECCHLNRFMNKEAKGSTTIGQLIKGPEVETSINSVGQDKILIVLKSKIIQLSKIKDVRIMDLAQKYQLPTTKTSQSAIRIGIKQRYSGGGFQEFLFSTLSQPVFKEFTNCAPDYRIIYPGLNLEGICKNLHCDARNKKAWCRKNYGKIIMNMEIKRSQCPLCKQKLQNVQNIGIYKAKATINGMKSDGEEFHKVYINSQEKLLTFQDKDETKCNWLYLEIIVEQL